MLEYSTSWFCEVMFDTIYWKMVDAYESGICKHLEICMSCQAILPNLGEMIGQNNVNTHYCRD